MKKYKEIRILHWDDFRSKQSSNVVSEQYAGHKREK